MDNHLFCPSLYNNIALSVVEQMLISFNKPGHLANDTAFIFPSGQQLFASRAILAIQCPRIAQFLYPKEGIIMSLQN